MASLAETTAVILAGGLGTRLRSVVADRPKVLAVVAGQPFLTRLLDQVHDAGVVHVVLSTGHLGEQVEAAFGATYKGLRLTYSREREPLGTGGALRLALGAVASAQALVMNGDSYCRSDLAGLARSHAERAAEVSIVLTQVADTSRFGSVVVDDELRVQSFAEKTAARGAGWINAGIYLLNRPLIDAMPTGRALSLEREMFPLWLTRRFFAYRSAGPFLDIGTPESYAAAEQFFA